MGRAEREQRKRDQHDAQREIYQQLRGDTDAPTLTHEELFRLKREHPDTVKSVRQVGGKYEVHFFKGKRPKGW